MDRLSHYVIFFLCSFGCNALFADCAQCYLRDKINPDNHRYGTFVAVLNLITERNVKTIVETGTSRHGSRNCAGDGCSTVIFAEWATNHGAAVYSVDINPQAIQSAMNALPIYYQESVNFITGDSVNFLFNFEKTIDFLYLDSYDFEVSKPMPSQLHHFREIVAAYPWLTPDSIVMIDDCDLPHGGKGKLAIKYLLDHGWVVFKSGYQVILVHKSSLQ